MYTATGFSLLRNGWLVPHDMLVNRYLLSSWRGRGWKEKLTIIPVRLTLELTFFLFHYYVQTFPFNLLMPNCIQDNDYQQVLGSWDVECLAGNKWSRNALWRHLGKNWRLFEYDQESLRRLRNCTITSLKSVTALCRRNTLGAFQCDRSFLKWRKLKFMKLPYFQFGKTNKLVGESIAEKTPFFNRNRIGLTSWSCLEGPVDCSSSSVN